MTDQEFLAWLFPPKLTLRRKIVINVVMFIITLIVVWLFNNPASPLFAGDFQ